jgi:hypothetical protein
MWGINSSVGFFGANSERDVAWVQSALLRHRNWLSVPPPISATGLLDTSTQQAIDSFQVTAAALLEPSQTILPLSFTVQQLGRILIPAPRSPAFAACSFGHYGGRLTDSDYIQAAAELKCEVNAIRAVAQQESLRGAWDASRRPTILFERHKFSSNTKRLYDWTHPDISSRSPYRKAKDGQSSIMEEFLVYGKDSQQWKRLFRAAVLNESEALQSASWGRFQMLGDKFSDCGFASVYDFVESMMTSERYQLDAFVSFVKKRTGAQKCLQQLNWGGFAFAYNGSDYNKGDNHYDTDIATAYNRLSSGH